jgi:hypothetical protein
MGKKPSDALSKPLLKPADFSELIEDLPNVTPLAKGREGGATKAYEVEHA